MHFSKKTVKYTESIIFIVLWLVFIINPVVMYYNNDLYSSERVFDTWLRLIPFLVLSTVNHYLLIPHLFYKRKLLYFISTLLLLVLLSFSLKIYRKYKPINFVPVEGFSPDKQVRRDPPPMFHKIPKPPLPGEFRNEVPKKPIVPTIPFINSMFIAILILGFDIGLRTSFKYSKTEQQRNKLEKEKVKSELAFLRNQISPHFFMNTLNNIHSLIDIDTEEAKESIIQLSKLMRHLLYDSEEERILLTKEVQFIQSYVDLMKLRYTDNVKVSFNIDFNPLAIKVPPLLFTSLIENAFKYGVSYKKESFISIILSKSENSLMFSISNSVAKKQLSNELENSSGIGLVNTKKRLDLLYGQNYKMDVVEKDESFTVTLKLEL